MSDATSTPAPGATPKKNGKLTTVVILIVAVVAIISGIAKMKSGLGEMFGSLDPKVKQLVDDADASGAKALEVGKAADEKFNTLIAAVNAKTLDELRTAEADAVAETRKSLAEVAEHFRTSATKLDEAGKLEIPEKLKQFLTPKAGMYHAYAETYDYKGEIVAVIVDTSISDKNALIARMNELTEKADAALKSGNDLSAKADAVVKDIKEKK